MMGIDRNSHMPLYIQLKEMLSENIYKGIWKPGEKLPTEDEIQKEYELSRTTVRQALRELELEGRIQRQAGRGTFVSQPKIQEGTETFSRDLSMLGEQGLQLFWKILSAEEVSATESVAKRLNVPMGEKVFCLERMRMNGDEAIAHAVSYIAPPFISQIDLSRAVTGGTMNYLTPLGLDNCIAERVVEAQLADSQEMRMLNVERCSPVLVLTRLLRTCEGQPVELYRGVYRGDRFRYHIQELPAQV